MPASTDTFAACIGRMEPPDRARSGRGYDAVIGREMVERQVGLC